MANLRKGFSAKRNAPYWKARWIHPVTGKEVSKRFWFAKKPQAEAAFNALKEQQALARMGLAVHQGLDMSYTDIVALFLREAELSTEQRTARLKRELEANLLALVEGKDFFARGELKERLEGLQASGDYTAHFLMNSVQKPLKQVTRWMHAYGYFPTDPLGKWSLVEWEQETQRKAFTPAEMNGILAASSDIDGWLGRGVDSSMAYLALLCTGNRPSAVLAATGGDLKDGQIKLPPGNGKKRNGAATLPPELFTALFQTVKRSDLGAPLFKSRTGLVGADRLALGRNFNRCMALYWVRANYRGPLQALKLADCLIRGKYFTTGGPPATKAETVERLTRIKEAYETMAKSLQPAWKHWRTGRDLYSLRTTHITWAECLCRSQQVRIQVGHAGLDVHEKNYQDPELSNPSASSMAVWDVLEGRRDLQGREIKEPVELRKVVGLEQFQAEQYFENARSVTGSVGVREPKSQKVEVVQSVSGKELKMVYPEGFEPSTSAFAGLTRRHNQKHSRASAQSQTEPLNHPHPDPRFRFHSATLTKTPAHYWVHCARLGVPIDPVREPGSVLPNYIPHHVQAVLVRRGFETGRPAKALLADAAAAFVQLGNSE